MFRTQFGEAGDPLSQARFEETTQPAAQGEYGAPQGQLAQDYESPVVMVIGSVRDLTAGSAASGNKDANSQYYW